MSLVAAVGLGIGLATTGWIGLRLSSNAGLQPKLSMLVDAFLPAVGFLLLSLATARPVFAGVTIASICTGFGYADRAKRAVLGEPIVYTDVFQAFDIFRHPRLALPFPNLSLILAGLFGAIGLIALWFHVEPPVWSLPPGQVLVVIVCAVLLGHFLGGPALPFVEHFLRRFEPSSDPNADAQRFGVLGLQLIYGFLARAQRSGRRISAAREAERKASRSRSADALFARVGPVVMVQCESFFDARRLSPAIPNDLLPNFDACRRTAQWGRLKVPCWGANTVRTEFAVLSGLSQSQLGFDRFNPYHGFARAPVPTLAWTLQAAGYRTICIHPFDRRFYGRHEVMPNLGFDEFIGEEAFADAERINGYVSDVAVAKLAKKLVEERGPRVFLFLITMENHGPWPADPNEALTKPLLPETIRARLAPGERASLTRYLRSLVGTDTMLGILTQVLGRSGVLAMYGDHLPSFPGIFSQFGVRDFRSDYLLWRAAPTAQAVRRLDLAAHELSGALFQFAGAHSRESGATLLSKEADYLHGQARMTIGNRELTR